MKRPDGGETAAGDASGSARVSDSPAVSSPHSVLADVRDALAAPRGDAGVDARMLALDSVQSLIEQLEAAMEALERIKAMPPEASAYQLWEIAEAVLSNPAKEPQS